MSKTTRPPSRAARGFAELQQFCIILPEDHAAVEEEGERCFCEGNILKHVNAADVKTLQLLNSSASCSKTEIIITLKTGKKVCLDPNEEQGKRMLGGKIGIKSDAIGGNSEKGNQQSIHLPSEKTILQFHNVTVGQPPSFIPQLVNSQQDKNKPFLTRTTSYHSGQKINVNRCLCPSGLNMVRLQHVEKIEVHPAGPSCEKVDIIVTFKNGGGKKCLNPESKFAQNYIRKLLKRKLLSKA